VSVSDWPFFTGGLILFSRGPFFGFFRAENFVPPVPVLYGLSVGGTLNSSTSYLFVKVLIVSFLFFFVMDLLFSCSLGLGADGPQKVLISGTPAWPRPWGVLTFLTLGAWTFLFWAGDFLFFFLFSSFGSMRFSVLIPRAASSFFSLPPTLEWGVTAFFKFSHLFPPSSVSLAWS